MTHWTISEPTTLDFDGMVALKATLVAGSISVLAGDERPAVQIIEVAGPPLGITHEAGILDIVQENLLDGVLRWLRSQECRAAIVVKVPRGCPVRLNLVTADAIITGLDAHTTIKTASGDITLDGVSGQVDVNTVAGTVEARGLDGTITFTSVSGDLSLAGGSIERLTARTVSGRVAADIRLADTGQVQINTVSGEVALRLAPSIPAEVDLHSMIGRIETSSRWRTGVEQATAKAVTGTLGAGTGRLAVGSVSGNLTVLSRPDDDALPGNGPGPDAKEANHR